MSDHEGRARRFLDLHHAPAPLLLANPWDVGSARLLAWAGFDALATTSSGMAAAAGELDGNVSREAALAHARAIAGATPLPVNGDLENGFGDRPADVADTVGLALDAGLAGCSIEDWSGSTFYDLALARERIAAAADAAHSGPVHMVLTARAENHIRGNPDLADTVTRLQAYQEAGADVLYAPGLRTADEIRTVVDSVDRPVNVLALAGAPAVWELAGLGVSRISVGGGFAFAAYGALIQSARELLDSGTYEYGALAGLGSSAAREAFGTG